MAMSPLDGFIGASYTGQALIIDGERAVNLYLETIQSGHGKSGAPNALIGSPGLKKKLTLSDGPVRGLWSGAGRTFAVGGGTFFEIFSDDATPPQNRGSVNVGAGPAEILANGSQVFIVSGGQGYIDTGTQILPVVAASTGTFMDGYFIAATPNSNKFQISQINDGLNWDPLDFGVKQAYPDAISRIIAAFEQLWIFGFDTTEVWWDSGAANFPFQRVPNGVIQIGCYAPFSVAKVGENMLMWLGGSSELGHGVVYMTNGLVPQRISNHAMEWQIQNVYANIRDAEGWSYQDSGHTFYVLYFPTANATWVYDLTTGTWHERGFWNTATGSYQANLARCHTFDFDQHLVGSWKDGTIYRQDLNLLDDDGSPIRRLRSSPHISNNMMWTRYNQLLLDMQVGVTPQGLTPQMMLRWSDDGGQRWSNEVWSSAGKVGQYLHRVIWNRLGRSRNRSFEVTSTAAIPHVWVNAYVNIQPGAGY